MQNKVRTVVKVSVLEAVSLIKLKSIRFKNSVCKYDLPLRKKGTFTKPSSANISYKVHAFFFRNEDSAQTCFKDDWTLINL